MALIPSALFLFDTTAILAGKTLDWQAFSQLGECYVPNGVLEQLEFMCDRASEPDTERASREFMRFYPNGGWKKTSITAEHPTLKPAPGNKLSQRARLVQQILGCAYGLALRYPDRLIVLVANDQPMLQQLHQLQTKNLCGLPLPPMMQWVRLQRRPPVITQHMQRMRSQSGNPSASTGQSPQRKVVHPDAKQGWDPPKKRWAPWRSLDLQGLVSNTVSLLIVVAILGGLWRFVSPSTFAQFWQRLPIVGAPK